MNERTNEQTKKNDWEVYNEDLKLKLLENQLMGAHKNLEYITEINLEFLKLNEKNIKVLNESLNDNRHVKSVKLLVSNRFNLFDWLIDLLNVN